MEVGEGRDHEGHGGLGQGHVDVRAAARALQPFEAGDGSDGGVCAGDGVGDEGAGAVGAVVVGVAGDGGEPAGGLDVRAVGDPVAPRAGRAEAADGNHHESGIHLAQLFVGEAEVGHDAGAVVLDDDIGLRGEVEEDAAALVGREVEGDIALVAVHLVEVAGAVPVVLAGVEAGVVAAARGGARGQLDLDDLGAEVGEVAAGDRSGPVVRDLDDTEAREGGVGGHSFRTGGGRGVAGQDAGKCIGGLGIGPGVGPTVGATGHGAAFAVAEVGAVGEVVVGEQPGHIGHGRDGDTQPLRFRDDLHDGAGGAPLANDGLDLLEVVATPKDGLEVVSGGEIGAVAQQEDVLVDEEGEEVHPPVLRADKVGAGAHEDAALVGPGDGGAPVGAEHGLGGAHLQLLPLAGAAGVAEGGEGGEGDLQAGVELRLVAGHAQGLALGVAGDRPVAAEGVVRQLVASPARIGTAAAEVVGVRDDDGGVGGAQQFEERILLEFREGEVGEDEVEVGGERGEGGEQRVSVEAVVAELDVLLEVGVDEVAGRPVAGSGVAPAPPRASRAEVGEEAGGVGPRDAAGEVEHAEVERGGPVGHARNFTAPDGG